MTKFVEVVYRIFTATLGLDVEGQMVIDEVERTSQLFRKFLELDAPINGEEFEHLIARFIHWAISNHGSGLLKANSNLVFQAFVFAQKNRPDLMTKVEQEITAVVRTMHGKEMFLVANPFRDNKKVFTTIVP